MENTINGLMMGRAYADGKNVVFFWFFLGGSKISIWQKYQCEYFTWYWYWKKCDTEQKYHYPRPKWGTDKYIFQSQILDPKMVHFLKRFPPSNAQNSSKFSACGGPNIRPPSKSDLLNIRGGQTRGGTDSCLSPDG